MKAPPPHHVTTAPEPARSGTRAGTRLPRGLLLNRAAANGSGRLRSTGPDDYVRLPAPVVLAYRLGSGPHQQTGIVVESSVADYHHGHIRRHEATRSEREDQLLQRAETTGIERMPVLLAHGERAGLRSLLAGITTVEPDVACRDAGGTTHALWIRHDAELARAAESEIGDIAPLYIADGHHRMAAAERYSERRGFLGGEHAGAFTLAALFPKDEMRLFGHHRCLPLLPGTSTSDVAARLAEHPSTARIEECVAPDVAHPAPGIITVHVHDRNYRLRLRTPRENDHARTALDVVALDEEFLPLLHDLSTPGGDTNDGETSSGECSCTAQHSVRFVPQPPSIEQVMALSDVGLLLPPKSTWFDPKASAELLARELT